MRLLISTILTMIHHSMRSDISMLYKHQQEALSKIQNGSILLGGVGTGKSRTALAYYFEKVCGGSLEPFEIPKRFVKLIIITTAKKRDSKEWENELAPFLLDMNKDDIIIDSWNNISKYIKEKHAFFIFDEQRVPGKGSWSKSFLMISKSNEWILLTATPGDTWMDYVPIMIANGFYKNRSDFIHQHVVYKRFAKFPIIDHYVNVRKLYKIRDDITVKMEFHKVTKPHDIFIDVNYDKDSYLTIMRSKWDVFNNKPFDNISSMMYAARKIINSDSSRIDALFNILTTLTVGAIIFYNYTYELNIIKQVCEDAGINYTQWNGQKHQEPLDLSNKNNVYIVQYSAGAEGWECTSTNTIIFYSQTYSYKILTQAKGRVDRLNTSYEDLVYYHLISNSPLDRGIRLCLKRKERFNETKFICSEGY